MDPKIYGELELFEYKPLSERMRPETLNEFYGKEAIVGKNSPIRKMIESDALESMIFWGPDGVGKTTLARIIARQTNAYFYEFKNDNNSANEMDQLLEKAQNNHKKVIVFVDEIHKFSKKQQESFISYIEYGDTILIGATTKNPSYEISQTLLNRCQVFVLNSLTPREIFKILKKALLKCEEYRNVEISDEALEVIANNSNNEVKIALNILEKVINIMPLRRNKKVIVRDNLEKLLRNKIFSYDKTGEEHYNLISALHKSMRNNDPDAALYYLARMLEIGGDPTYIAKRLIRFASEDIGLADKDALVQATSAYETTKYLGLPECNLCLAQVVIYLSLCPKSNDVYKAYTMAKLDARRTMTEKVPKHLQNSIIKKIDEKNTNPKEFMPQSLKGHKYYEKTN